MKKSYFNKMAGLILAVCMLLGATAASATTIFPALELNPVNATGNSSGVTMSGMAPFILSDDTTVLLDLSPDLPFTLTSDTSGTGTLMVDGGTALSATFSNLTITYTFAGIADFSADLTITVDTLLGGLAAGHVEGSLNGTGMFTAGQSLLGQTFTTASSGIAKVGGAVVPVPAAVWLFGSGLLGLAGIARRKTQA